MKYNKEERRAINEANRAVNEAERAAKDALLAAMKVHRDADQAAKERKLENDRAYLAHQKAEAEYQRRTAYKAAVQLSEAERIARAQGDFESRVDAFTARLAPILAELDLKLLGGWTKDEWRMVPPTYNGTVVELASTTSEHKAIIRVQIGQGLKR